MTAWLPPPIYSNQTLLNAQATFAKFVDFSFCWLAGKFIAPCLLLALGMLKTKRFSLAGHPWRMNNLVSH